jgi:hypothetical protein
MDKNKIVTIIVAIIWIVVVFLKRFQVINLTQYRIILLILVAFYAIIYYRIRLFKKK